MFEDNNHVCSVRLCPPEAMFWPRGQMVGQTTQKAWRPHSLQQYRSPFATTASKGFSTLSLSAAIAFSLESSGREEAAFFLVSKLRHS